MANTVEKTPQAEANIKQVAKNLKNVAEAAKKTITDLYEFSDNRIRALLTKSDEIYNRSGKDQYQIRELTPADIKQNIIKRSVRISTVSKSADQKRTELDKRAEEGIKILGKGIKKQLMALLRITKVPNSYAIAKQSSRLLQSLVG